MFSFGTLCSGPFNKHGGTRAKIPTPELLFAVVKENDFYVLGIFDHKAWSKQDLLNIVRANWPELIDPYMLKGGEHMKVLGLRRNYTDEEVLKLRKVGINALTQEADGSVRLGPGDGITTNGKSMSVTMDVIKLEDHVEAPANGGDRGNDAPKSTTRCPCPD